jgi:hypothetical protein
MYTEIVNGKREIIVEIKLDKDIGGVLGEYNFKEKEPDFFYLPNTKETRIEILVIRDETDTIEEITLKMISTVKEFAFFKCKNQLWVVQDQSGEGTIGEGVNVLREIMEKIREFWGWFI